MLDSSPRFCSLAVRACWLLLAVGAPGCSGSFTLLPSGDILLKETKDVRRAVPASVPAPRELEKTVLPAYLIQPGDTLLVEPATLDSSLRFPADQTVLPDGTIDLGRFGKLVAAGKTIEQVESDTTAAVRAVEKSAEQINVRLVNQQSAVYYVLGEVSSPGSFPLIGRETVLDGILSAGGLTDKASLCNIILTRPSLPGGCRTVMPICYRHITQLGDTTTNFQLMPGDRIVVATRTLSESLLPCLQSCPCCRGTQCPCPTPDAAVSPRTTVYSSGAVITSVEAAALSETVQPIRVERIELPGE